MKITKIITKINDFNIFVIMSFIFFSVIMFIFIYGICVVDYYEITLDTGEIIKCKYITENNFYRCDNGFDYKNQYNYKYKIIGNDILGIYDLNIGLGIYDLEIQEVLE